MKPFGRTLVVKLLGRQPSYGFMVKKLRQIWARKDLPAPLFDKKFLLNLGNVIGKAIKLDIHTTQRARGKFARMCVELDLTKPLVPEFEIEGQVLSIVYESLGMLCNKCGRFGHSREVCEDFQKRKMNEKMDVEDLGSEQADTNGKGMQREFWKTMQRPRRQRRSPVPTQNQQSGSRFAVLEGEMGEEGGMKRGEGAHEASRAADRQVPKPRKLGSSGFADRSEKEENGHSGLMRSVVRDMHVVLKETQNMVSSGKFVPESNMELVRNKGVSLVEKENLNLGDQGLKRWDKGDMSMGDGVNRDDDSIESSGMSIELVYATPGRISGGQANKVIRSWGFNYSRRVEAEGFSREVRGSMVRDSKFEAMWLMHDNFEALVQNHWKGGEDAHVKLSLFQQDLIRWNKKIVYFELSNMIWAGEGANGGIDITKSNGKFDGFTNQFLFGGYNTLIQSICEDVEKEHPAKNEVGDFGLNPWSLEKLTLEKEYALNRSSGCKGDNIGPDNEIQHEKIV
ncbi:hypothetical protein K1719_019421 [Acacia pycnantha]|nr:hypothetical protein K1719_019421 [Acacia pycnantha]